jgi:hypothetical protein
MADGGARSSDGTFARCLLVCQVSTAGEVDQAEARLAAGGLATGSRPGTECCYARQDKVWVHDPDGMPWEYYTVLEHIETP